jgi:hypothetical protein
VPAVDLAMNEFSERRRARFGQSKSISSRHRVPLPGEKGVPWLDRQPKGQEMKIVFNILHRMKVQDGLLIMA